ncbi:hypothetical protein F7725_010940 [Dissostichus mawsoni]|uniref:Uncharacterized protein n=1 Tax=Dissostichus mawsoni TaxID=36200 RepID=A0A7J5Z7G2_DISMA|nr:hypothetical protein F7725_010906 [Dissostichus mawsoni]KAF3857739.1 hypothetical protein F7725_010940 [Dissostichus mawsoni]
MEYWMPAEQRVLSVSGLQVAQKPTAVLLSVVFTAGFLLAVFWGVAHCHPDRCRTFFRKEPLPHSLKADWVIQIPISPEDAELCELIQVCSDCPSEDL